MNSHHVITRVYLSNKAESKTKGPTEERREGISEFPAWSSKSLISKLLLIYVENTKKITKKTNFRNAILINRKFQQL